MFTAELKLTAATLGGLLSEPGRPSEAHQSRCDLFQPDQKQRGQTPADRIWAYTGDDKEKVTGCQSNSLLTHGSVYHVLIHRPDRRGRADY